MIPHLNFKPYGRQTQFAVLEIIQVIIMKFSK